MISKETEEIGASLAQSAKRDDGKLFVMQWGDEWQLHLEKKDDPLKTFKTKTAAIRNARQYLNDGIAKKVVIANKKGDLSYL